MYYARVCFREYFSIIAYAWLYLARFVTSDHVATNQEGTLSNLKLIRMKFLLKIKPQSQRNGWWEYANRSSNEISQLLLQERYGKFTRWYQGLNSYYISKRIFWGHRDAILKEKRINKCKNKLRQFFLNEFEKQNSSSSRKSGISTPRSGLKTSWEGNDEMKFLTPYSRLMKTSKKSFFCCCCCYFSALTIFIRSRAVARVSLVVLLAESRYLFNRFYQHFRSHRLGA